MGIDPEDFLCWRPNCQGRGCVVLRRLEVTLSGRKSLLAPPWKLLDSRLTIYLLCVRIPCHSAMSWEEVEIRGLSRSVPCSLDYSAIQTHLSSLLYKVSQAQVFCYSNTNGLIRIDGIDGDGWAPAQHSLKPTVSRPGCPAGLEAFTAIVITWPSISQDSVFSLPRL